MRCPDERTGPISTEDGARAVEGASELVPRSFDYWLQWLKSRWMEEPASSPSICSPHPTPADEPASEISSSTGSVSSVAMALPGVHSEWPPPAALFSDVNL